MSAAEGHLLFQPMILLNSSPMTFAGVDAPREIPPAVREGGDGKDTGGTREHLARILEAACLLPMDLIDLHLSLHAPSLAGEGPLVDLLEQVSRRHAVAPSRLVIEPRNPPHDSPGFLAVVERLRSAGVRVALDLTAGIEGEGLLQIRPDYFRIGGPFLPHGSSDFFRLALLDFVCDLAWKFGATVVATGVSRDEELCVLRSRDVPLAQGPLFGGPLSPRQLLQPDFLRRFPFPAPSGSGKASAP